MDRSTTLAVRAAFLICIGGFRGARRCGSQEGWKEGLNALEEAVTRRCEELKKESYGTLLKLPLFGAAEARAETEPQSHQAPTVSSAPPTSPGNPAIRVLAGIFVLCILLALWGLYHERGVDLLSIAIAVGFIIAGIPYTIYVLYGNRPFLRLADRVVLSGYRPTEPSSDDPDRPKILGRQGFIAPQIDPQSDDALRVLVFGTVGMRWWPPGFWMVADGFTAKKDGSIEPLPFEVLDEYW